MMQIQWGHYAVYLVYIFEVVEYVMENDGFMQS